MRAYYQGYIAKEGDTGLSRWFTKRIGAASDSPVFLERGPHTSFRVEGPAAKVYRGLGLVEGGPPYISQEEREKFQKQYTSNPAVARLLTKHMVGLDEVPRKNTGEVDRAEIYGRIGRSHGELQDMLLRDSYYPGIGFASIRADIKNPSVDRRWAVDHEGSRPGGDYKLIDNSSKNPGDWGPNPRTAGGYHTRPPRAERVGQTLERYTNNISAINLGALLQDAPRAREQVPVTTAFGKTRVKEIVHDYPSEKAYKEVLGLSGAIPTYLPDSFTKEIRELKFEDIKSPDKIRDILRGSYLSSYAEKAKREGPVIHKRFNERIKESSVEVSPGVFQVRGADLAGISGTAMGNICTSKLSAVSALLNEQPDKIYMAMDTGGASVGQKALSALLGTTKGQEGLNEINKILVGKGLPPETNYEKALSSVRANKVVSLIHTKPSPMGEHVKDVITTHNQPVGKEQISFLRKALPSLDIDPKWVERGGVGGNMQPRGARSFKELLKVSGTALLEPDKVKRANWSLLRLAGFHPRTTVKGIPDLFHPPIADMGSHPTEGREDQRGWLHKAIKSKKYSGQGEDSPITAERRRAGVFDKGYSPVKRYTDMDTMKGELLADVSHKAQLGRGGETLNFLQGEEDSIQRELAKKKKQGKPLLSSLLARIGIQNRDGREWDKGFNTMQSTLHKLRRRIEQTPDQRKKTLDVALSKLLSRAFRNQPRSQVIEGRSYKLSPMQLGANALKAAKAKGLNYKPVRPW